MAGVRLGANKKLMIAGAIALVILAIIAGTLPVRLQRDDSSVTDLMLGISYAMLALLGFYAIYRSLKVLFKRDVLAVVLTSTLTMTSMIFATILTASMFSLVFIGLGGDERIEQILSQMPGGAVGALIFSMLVIFVLGFFLDFVEIAVIVLPPRGASINIDGA